MLRQVPPPSKASNERSHQPWRPWTIHLWNLRAVSRHSPMEVAAWCIAFCVAAHPVAWDVYVDRGRSAPLTTVRWRARWTNLPAPASARTLVQGWGDLSVPSPPTWRKACPAAPC